MLSAHDSASPRVPAAWWDTRFMPAGCAWSPRPRGHGGGAGRDHGHVVVEAGREPDDPDRDPVRQAFQSFHQVEARMRVALPCRTHAVTSHVR